MNICIQTCCVTETKYHQQQAMANKFNKATELTNWMLQSELLTKINTSTTKSKRWAMGINESCTLRHEQMVNSPAVLNQLRVLSAMLWMVVCPCSVDTRDKTAKIECFSQLLQHKCHSVFDRQIRKRTSESETNKIKFKKSQTIWHIIHAVPDSRQSVYSSV